MGLRISYRSVVIRFPNKGAGPVVLYMMDCDQSVWVASKNKKTQTLCKNPTLVLSQSVTSPRPPTASQ